MMLDKKEVQFVHQLQTWNRTQKSVSSLFFNAILVLGGAVIVTVSYLTIRHLNDQTIISSTVPGFLIGLLLIGLYLVGSHYVKQRAMFASIIDRLYKES